VRCWRAWKDVIQGCTALPAVRVWAAFVLAKLGYIVVGSLDRDSKHLGFIFVSVWSLETLSYLEKKPLITELIC
jgi:hypothetical protein